MNASSESGLWATVILDEATPAVYRTWSDDDPLANRIEDDFRGVVQVELHHHVRAVRLDRRQAEIQQGGNLLVRSPFRQQLQDFLLAIGEQMVRVGQPARLQTAHVVLDENRRHGAAEERLAGRDRTNRGQQV